MSTNVIPNESSDDQGNECAVITVEGRRTELTIQQLQDVYSQVTGKAEELARNALVLFQITMEDLRQLNCKVQQLCEQYNIVGKTCDITVTHSEDNKEKFSSFERFSMYDTARTAATTEIVLNYNFLIVLPKIKQPQSYAITVRLASQIAMQKEIERDRPFPGHTVLLGRNIRISVKYIDYLVAKNFLDSINQWIKCLPTVPQPSVITWLKKRSHLVPRIFQYVGLGIISFLVVRTAPLVIANSPGDLKQLFSVSFYSALSIFLTFRFSRFLGRIIENEIDASYALSSLQLNRGDVKLLQDAKNANKWSLLKVIMAFLGMVLVGVLQNLLAEWVGKITNV